MRKYSNKIIMELGSELCSALGRLRKGYVDAAEDLILLIDDSKPYPYEFVVYRLTGYSPSSSVTDQGHLMQGGELKKDLLTLILDICDSFELRTSDYDEKTLDNETLAKNSNVSTKTVQRWRDRGLVARRMIFPDGKRRLAFLESSVNRFFRAHKAEIKRSAKFSKLTKVDRKRIIARSRRMVSFTNCTLSDVAKRLAKHTGRAVETMRYTIRKHDAENPDKAVFPHLLVSLDKVKKRRIYQDFLKGIAVQQLAAQHRRTRGSIYRIINEVRALQLLESPISYVYNEEFDAANADQVILTVVAEPEEQAPAKPVKAPADLPPYLKSLYEVPLLTKAKEQSLFRRYNFLKYTADKFRKRIDLNRIQANHVKRIETLLLQANVLKNQIVRANLRLVVSIAKRHISGPLNLFELVSDGNISLMRAVEKFDYARGFRFSTYASWAIMRNFARSVPKERYHLDRFSTGHDELLDIAAGLRTYEPQEGGIAELRDDIEQLLSHLSLREQTVLMSHFGLNEKGESKTFEQVGKDLGISKERVRQIELKALEKLRDISSD
ncbi:MAG: sigma-70 family RNA polymerase sigma factor [Phycisphaerae bacterium]|nr:sigma-70 family RNA polymerase sigma factor [Phycisphaerae bacterium]